MDIAAFIFAIDFGQGGNSLAYQRCGWLEPEPKYTWTEGYSSELVLPRPTEPDDYVLEFDVHPFTSADKIPIQKLQVLVNGTEVASFAILVTATLECLLPWSLLENRDEIEIKFLHPGASSQNAVYGEPDERLIAFAFQQIRLLKLSDLGRTETEVSRSLINGSSRHEETVHDSDVPAPPPAGHIDTYGYNPSTGCWIFVGWVSRRWTEDALIEVVGDFSDRVEAGPVRVGFYSRAELGQLGVGIVVAMQAKPKKRQLAKSCLVSLAVQTRDSRLNLAGNEKGPTGIEQLTDTLRSISISHSADPNFTTVLDWLPLEVHPGALPNAARGFVDLYTYSPSPPGWLFLGWVSQPWPETKPSPAVAHFSDRNVSGALDGIFFKRPDVRGMGVGCLMFLGSSVADQPSPALRSLHIDLDPSPFDLEGSGKRAATLEEFGAALGAYAQNPAFIAKLKEFRPELLPPVSPDEAIERLEGHIDFYGYHRGARGWLIYGWLSAEAIAMGRAKIVAHFDDGPVVSELLPAFYHRAGLEGRGIGIIMFLESPIRTDSRLRSLELIFAAASAELEVTAIGAQPTDQELIEAVGPILVREQQSSECRALLEHLWPHDKLPPKLRFLEGHIDYYGYHTAAECWVISGWLSAAWADKQGPEAVVVSFEDGTVTRTPLVIFYDRGDLDDAGKGFLLFIVTEEGKREHLKAIEFKFGGFARSVRAIAGVPVPPEPKLIEEIKQILGGTPNWVQLFRGKHPTLEYEEFGALLIPGGPKNRKASGPVGYHRPEMLFDASWYRTLVHTHAADAYRHYCTKGLGKRVSPSPLFDLEFYQKSFPDTDFGEQNPLEHYLSMPAKERARTHLLFSPDFYRENWDRLPEGVDPLLHYIRNAAGRMRPPHPLFDPDFYLQEYPDVATDGMLPLKHYIAFGAREGRKPHPLFDPAWYVNQTDGDPDATVSALQHYLNKGDALGLSPHPLFDSAWYRHGQMERSSQENALCHFIQSGDSNNRDPNPLFSTSWYRLRHPDVAARGSNALQHYVRHGAREGRDPHPLFDTAWYAMQADIAIAKTNPLRHFFEQAQPPNPHPLFDPAWYLSQTQDPAAAANPILHYIVAGHPAGLSPHRLFDTSWYRRTHVIADGENPLSHFVAKGDAEGLDPCPVFSVRWYRKRYPDIAEQDVNSLRHYILHGAQERRTPHPLFDVGWYLSQTENPDGIVDPLFHYLEYGAAAGLSPHPIFDVEWYLAQANEPDAAVCPLQHYIVKGASEGLSPNPLFDPTWYLSQTDDPDAAACPLRHYVETGSSEGLRPHPLFDPAWYRLTQMDELVDDEPLGHFLCGGDAKNLDPNPLFSTVWYRQRYPEVRESGANALRHYVLHGGREGRDPHPAFSDSNYLARSPECRQTGQISLVHALSQMPPAARWQPVIPPEVIAQYRSQASQPDAAASPDIVANYPSARRPLAAFLTAEFDREAAKKVVGYFEVIDSVQATEPGSEARQQALETLLARMRHLSENAMDDRPIEASIIVPVYNQIAYTIACVLSLFEHKNNRRFEIIIGNDVSTDETREIFSAVGGVVICATPEKNGGFLINCNTTVRHASGKYVILLNNDTIVLDQWLDRLLEPFERFSGIGMVGSKLLNADGSLQEAGGIIWDDATGWNFGRGQDSTLPQFNYLKDVDYVSGASIAIPKAIWDELDGFDPRYIPAYSEDSDLAFALRARGLRTLYAPFSMVIHHEGVSHGRDVTVGLKAYQIENRHKFVAKWSATLQSEQFPDAQHVFLARDRSRSRRHILVVDHYVPQFDRDAGSRTLYEYCKMFVDGGLQVTFWPDNLYRDREYARALQEIGVEVLYGPQLVNKFDDWMKENGEYIDYAFVSRAHIGVKYIDAIRKHSAAKVLFYGHDLHFVRLEREFELTQDVNVYKEIEEWRTVETKMWQASDVIYYPAEDEVATIKSRYPDAAAKILSIYIYPNAEIEETRSLVRRGSSDAATIMMVAGFRHRPNVDAALWFVNQVLPKIKERVPDLTLILAGSSPPPEVMALAGDDVVVTGYVSDGLLHRLYRTTSVIVAPLRFGGGVKGKIIEAMRFGVPVATTTAGSQGMIGWPEYLEVGDTPAKFADAVIRLLDSEDLRRERALNALDYIEREYSYRSVASRMAADIPELLSLVD